MKTYGDTRQSLAAFFATVSDGYIAAKTQESTVWIHVGRKEHDGGIAWSEVMKAAQIPGTEFSIGKAKYEQNAGMEWRYTARGDKSFHAVVLTIPTQKTPGHAYKNVPSEYDPCAIADKLAAFNPSLVCASENRRSVYAVFFLDKEIDADTYTPTANAKLREICKACDWSGIDRATHMDTLPADVETVAGSGKQYTLDELKPAPEEPRRQKLVSYTMEDLARMDIKPPEFIVDGLLPIGLTIFAAPPKTGKSWMCLQLCSSVATGADFLGHHTHKCMALYCDLEGSPARTVARMKVAGMEPSKEISTLYKLPSVDDGLVDVLDEWLHTPDPAHPDIDRTKTKLIIIDTYARIKPNHGSRQDAYTMDSKTLAPLQEYALEKQIALLLVTHNRKRNASETKEDFDPYERITGSIGQMGAADTAWMVIGQRSAPEYEFLATGRDILDVKVRLAHNKDNALWVLLGDTATILRQRALDRFKESPVVRTIIHKVNESTEGCWAATSAEILVDVSEYTGIADETAATDRKLGKFLSDPDNVNRFMTEYQIRHTVNSRRLHIFKRIAKAEDHGEQLQI